MLCTNVMVAEAASFVHCQLDDLLSAGREPNLADDHAIAAANNELDGAANLVQLNAEIAQHLGGYALTLSDQPKQQVLSADVVVVEALGFFLREHEHLAGSLSKFVETIRFVHACSLRKDCLWLAPPQRSPLSNLEPNRFVFESKRRQLLQFFVWRLRLSLKN